MKRTVSFVVLGLTTMLPQPKALADAPEARQTPVTAHESVVRELRAPACSEPGVNLVTVGDGIGREPFAVRPAPDPVRCNTTFDSSLSHVMGVDKRVPLHGSKDCGLGPGNCVTSTTL